MLFKKCQPFPMMVTTVRLCKFIGLWHDTDLDKVCPQAVFTLASLTFCCIIPGICFVTRQDRDLIIRLKGMIEILAMSMFVLRIGAHVLHRGTLQKCFWEVQETMGQFVDSGHQEVQDMLEHLVKSADFITKGYTVALLSNASLYGDIPALIAIGQYLLGANITLFPPTILEADYVLFEHQSNILIWLPVLVLSIATQYSMLTSLAANECLYWNLLHHVSCLFKMVKFEISHLDECSSQGEFKERLVKIVTAHEAACRNALCLETALSPVMFILYCTFVTKVCAMMFLVTIVDDFFVIAMMLFVVSYQFFMVFSFSMLGTELTEASLAVAEAIYQSTWTERSPSEQKLMMFMQMRAQQRVAITVWKFFALGRASFSVAVKTVFQYFTIMRQLYEIQD